MKFKKTCEHCNQPVRISAVMLTLQGAVVEYNHCDGHFYCHIDNLPSGYPPSHCHVCNSTSEKHGEYCSVGGAPAYSVGADVLTMPGQYYESDSSTGKT